MFLRAFTLCLLVSLPALLPAETVERRVFINSGELLAIDSTTIDYKCFNLTKVFEGNNALIRIQVGDILNLVVVNNDSETHDFEVKGLANSNATISPGDSVLLNLIFDNAGVYIYSDPSEAGKNWHLGLAGMISVEKSDKAHFSWNLKEHQKEWNAILSAGGSVDPLDYDPDYFLVNGKSNPNINQDPVARVTGSVGDSLFINIANTGQSIHSLHFHGYHALILQSSKNASHIGRSKDTFPIFPMETLRLLIVPDKLGEYPVHDHNLVAVTGGGFYPNGMFLTLLIF